MVFYFSLISFNFFIFYLFKILKNIKHIIDNITYGPSLSKSSRELKTNDMKGHLSFQTKSQVSHIVPLSLKKLQEMSLTLFNH